MEQKKIIIKGRVNKKLNSNLLNIFNKCNDCFIFFIDYSNYNIPINSIFTKCIINDNPYVINWTLILITNQNFFQLDSIEEGYKTICGFKINSKINLINKIPFMKDWYNEINIELLTDLPPPHTNQNHDKKVPKLEL